MGDTTLIQREEARFRQSLEAYLKTRPGVTPAADLIAAQEEIARQSERLTCLMLPIALRGGLPGYITVRLAVFLPPYDPDRDLQILLSTLDHCSINSTAHLLDRSRDTVRGVTELVRISVEREARRLLGPHFHPPPRNPKRSRQTISDDF